MTEEESKIVDGVRDYFSARLKEIDDLNKSGTLSAFACYAWLIGALSHIAFVGQKSTAANEDFSRDRDCFVKFVGSFMSGYDASLMYENFRCGIIHACSLDETWKGDDGIAMPTKSSRMYLTHDSRFKKSKEFKLIRQGGICSIVLYYKDLSDDIAKAIGKMFENDRVRTSVLKAVNHQRLISPIENLPTAVTGSYHIDSSFTASNALSGVCVL